MSPSAFGRAEIRYFFGTGGIGIRYFKTVLSVSVQLRFQSPVLLTMSVCIHVYEHPVFERRGRVTVVR